MLPLPKMSARHSVPRALAILLTIATPAFAQAPQSAPAAPVEEGPAEKLFREGHTAAKAGEYEDAYRAYSASWELKKSWDTAAELGNASFHLGKMAEAAQHLSFALHHFPNTGKPEARARIDELLGKARAQVGALRLRVEPPDAKVSVDGIFVGMARDLPAEVYVEPGQRVLWVTGEGRTSDRRTVTAMAGRVDQIRLALGGASPPSSTNPLERDTSAEADALPPANHAPALIAGGVALAALGGGIALTVVAADKEGERDDRVEALPEENPCATGSPHQLECDAISDLDSEASTLRVLSYTTFGVAAVATAATIVFWPRSSKPRRSTRVTPLLGREVAGLSVGGQF